MENIVALDKRLVEVGIKLNGDVTLTKREFDAPPSINGRVSGIMDGVPNYYCRCYKYFY